MTRIHHPIQAAIEDVYAAGHTPRLQIDARRKDVGVPDTVRRSWQARLVIDLDPSYPLALEYDAGGLSVDLAFQGVVSRCRFGWHAVYAVIDRSTGRGIVVEGHLPAPELPPEQAWVDKSRKPRLAAVPSSAGAAQGSDQGSARSSEPPQPSSERPAPVTPFAKRLPSVPPSALEPPVAFTSEAPPPRSTPSTAPVGAAPEPQPSPSLAPGSGNVSDDAAKERRARFRVIDGGR